ncbi:hypothetical protein [Oricola thermophila]|uniref:DUF1127 domain-containing protein n=1 Tax=Oricola thermophila TaxID=2742145 RepID=A0A6N1V8B0_9HYPH|nr:hypothetical protein [Oricola thermophila]QKV17150.1 hypothetical protein HTY61_01050 [Oricola thermophila]
MQRFLRMDRDWPLVLFRRRHAAELRAGLDPHLLYDIGLRDARPARRGR